MTVIVILVVALLALYILFVRQLRYKRLDALVAQYGKTPLTPLTAQTIIQSLSMYDAPFIYTKALEFGLLRTYAIPTISRLLVQTSDLVTRTAIRVEETELLLSEMTVWHLNSERSTLALSRMNYLHAQYGKAISNDDLLYTLSVFILEPPKWMQAYDWRPMHELEIQANFLLWRSIGLRMNIKDIPDTYEEMKSWSEAYEVDHMIYAKHNEKLGNATIMTFLRPAPRFLHGIGMRAAHAFMDPRLRRAFKYSSAPSWLSALIMLVMTIRAVVVRNLMLPRSKPYLKLRATKTKDGLYRRTGWSFAPLYVKNTWLNTLVSRYMGFGALGKGTKWHNEGYTLESVGPDKFRSAGHADVAEGAAKMRACPFS